MSVLVLLGLLTSVTVCSEPTRKDRSLANTFPFNEGFVGTSADSNGISNKRCVDKVMMEEKVEWEVVVTCEHSYDKRCAKTLKTNYKPFQEEICRESYVKSCFIEYQQTAQNVTVTVCRVPLVKDCDSSGEQVCRTQYESECVTQREVHKVEDDIPNCQTLVEERCKENTSGYTTNVECSKWPREECTLFKKQSTKYTPSTSCSKIPVELCGPPGCGFKEGPEECHERVKTVVSDKPEEVCSLEPRSSCKFVTRLAPHLEEVELCFDVPKEVCTRSEVNPKKVPYPVVKKWCYGTTTPRIPTPEPDCCCDKCPTWDTEWYCPAAETTDLGLICQNNPYLNKCSNCPDCPERPKKCPPKCTCKRRGECSSGGVPECDMVPGCCPQHFNEVYGAVSFADEDGQGNDNN